MYRIAFLYVNNKDIATDAVDESIFKGLKAIKKLREPQYMETWLIRILINECNKELKKRKREIFYETIPENFSENLDNLDLKEAILHLPEDLKKVIILRYFCEYTLAKTADILDIPQGTVVTRQRKALKLLRVDLEEKEEVI